MKKHFILLATCLLLSACGAKEEKSASVATPQICSTSTTISSLTSASALTEEASTGFILKTNPNVGLRAGETEIFLQHALSGIASVQKLNSDFLLIESEQARTVEELNEILDPSLYEYIEPDYPVQFALQSNDPNIVSQWAHNVVNSNKAWDISRGSEEVIVAVLDSGIDPSHPDLVKNLWTNPGEVANGIDDDHNGFVDDIHGWNFVKNNPSVLADDQRSYHGTHVAGTIGAVGNNGVGISGHAQVVRIMTMKFLGSAGSGKTSDAIRAIDYAIAKGAKIINNSWGSTSFSYSLFEAIGRAKDAGILFVAAAGNNGANNDKTNFYPANYEHDNVISVAASTSADSLASFSNYGYKRVHLAAPGAKIYSTKNGNSYQTLSGTSMATPLVSGVLATMVAARPDLNYLQIKGALLASVDKVPAMQDKVMWGGRINAYRALAMVTGLPSSWTPPKEPEHNPACP